MSKKKKGGMPRLRFPEFQDIGGWETKPLKNFLSESKIRGNKGDNAKKLTVKLWGKGVYAKDSKIKGSKNTQYYKRKAGQIIYSKLDFLNGAFGLIPSKLDGYESTADLPCFDVKKDNNSIFLLKYILRKEFYSKVGEIADGSRKAKRIHQKTFLLFPVSFPQEEEQKKIANCLSSLDEIINLETEKLETLKSHKKGLMQQLFPREGETTPRLRFPEFRNAGGWETKPLGDIGEVKSSKRVHERDWKNTGVPFYRAREIVKFQNGKELDDPIFISQEKYDEIKKKYNIPKKGDILVTGVGTIGIPYIITHDNPFYFKDGNIIWLSSLTAAPQWIYLCLLNPQVMKNILNEQGSTVQTFTITQAKKLLIPFPSLSEQQKIANCFSSLDKIIDLQTQKLDTLKSHKKGLMQQLFPQEV